MVKIINYNEEQLLFKSEIEKFIKKEITPYYDEWEKEGLIDRNLWKKMGQMGMLCPNVSEEWGGINDFSYNVLVNQTLCENYATSIAVGNAIHSDIVATYIDKYGTQKQKENLLPKMISGEIVSCLGMTEPNAGSDLGSLQTKGIYSGDDLIVSGQKVFITNGYLADLILAAVRTEGEGYDGVSLVLIDMSSEGISKSLLKKIGLKSQDTAEIFFDEVRVPKENILGKAGHGFFMMMDELPRERLSLCVGAIASSRQILTDTIDYVKERTAFGKPISKFQNTQFEIAEMHSQLSAAECFVNHCINLDLKNELTTEMASELKIVTTDLQCDITDRCLQLFGGYGFMSEYPVARAFCDGRVQKIYGGTNEIMKVLVSRKLLN